MEILLVPTDSALKQRIEELMVKVELKGQVPKDSTLDEMMDEHPIPIVMIGVDVWDSYQNSGSCTQDGLIVVTDDPEFQQTKQIRCSPCSERCYVIVHVAEEKYKNQMYRAAAKKAGANGFLLKDHGPLHLVVTLWLAIDKLRRMGDVKNVFRLALTSKEELSPFAEDIAKIVLDIRENSESIGDNEALWRAVEEAIGALCGGIDGFVRRVGKLAFLLTSSRKQAQTDLARAVHWLLPDRQEDYEAHEPNDVNRDRDRLRSLERRIAKMALMPIELTANPSTSPLPPNRLTGIPYPPTS